MTTVQDIIEYMERLAPVSYAQKGDPIGLHFGRRDQVVSTVMVTLDVRPAVVEEAIRKKVDMIIAHHPPIFRPIRSFDVSIPQHEMYEQLIQHRIAVYAAHTNLDSAPNGLNDWLAEAFSLTNCQVLSVTNPQLGIGFGRVGDLPRPYSLEELLQEVSTVLDVPALRYVASNKAKEKSITRLAICGGAGEEFYTDALEKGAQVYITGDVYFHTAHDMQETELTVIDPGHHIEKICIPKLKHYLEKGIEEQHLNIEVLSCETLTEPFQFYIHTK